MANKPPARRRRAPAKKRTSTTVPTKVPRGGFWRVSLCAGANKWRTLPGVGSHFEADYVADTYRRRCQRVAVHRLGQPPRERVAPVLPASYRPPARDAETIQSLLAEFVRSNDKASVIVLNDALIEDGFDWAAFDLRDTLARGCLERRGLANRILSEVLNDSIVLEHGEWNFGRSLRGGATDSSSNPYVLIREQSPIFFRGGTKRGTSRKHQPRLVLWYRAGAGRRCRWRLYGSYPISEHGGSIEEAERIAHLDIADQKHERHPYENADYERCDACGFDHGYEYENAHAWHAANPY